MTTLYRLKYKIIEDGKTYQGVRVSEKSLERYLEFAYKNYRDATFIYLEHLETFEKPDESASSGESLIILPFDLYL